VSEPYVFQGIRTFVVQAHLVEALEAYVTHGVPPGDFLQAVLCNDLVEACGRADHINIQKLPAFAAWLYNEAPIPCWGSAEKVAAWVEAKERERAAAAPPPPGEEPTHG
jgi:hypothetical protein